MFISYHLHVGIQKYDIIKVHQGKARAQGNHPTVRGNVMYTRAMGK